MGKIRLEWGVGKGDVRILEILGVSNVFLVF